VTWEDGKARQQREGEYSVGTNLNSDVVFSPDGQFLVCAYGIDCWWSDDPEETSPGGEFKAGVVVITNLDTWEHRGTEVFLSVPAGWLADDPEDTTSLSEFSTPRFLDADQFEVRSGMGEVLRFRVAGERMA
jgi:hypothetical protein